MPSLVIYNPPKQLPAGIKVVGVMSENVHQIQYTHADDGADYEHPFDDGIQALALVLPDGSHATLLVGADGQNVWEDL